MLGEVICCRRQRRSTGSPPAMPQSPGGDQRFKFRCVLLCILEQDKHVILLVFGAGQKKLKQHNTKQREYYIYNYNKGRVIRLVDTLQMIFFSLFPEGSRIHDEKTHGQKDSQNYERAR